jgi:hypothetical protein
MTRSGNESESLRDGSQADYSSRRSHRLQEKRVRRLDESDDDTETRADDPLDRNGYGSEGSEPAATPSETVHLTSDYCRIQTSSMINGRKVLCICGVPFLECKRHVGARAKAEKGHLTRFKPGVYAKVTSIKGKYPHGEIGGYFRFEPATVDDRREDSLPADNGLDAPRDGPSKQQEDEIEVMRRKIDRQVREAEDRKLREAEALPTSVLADSLPPLPEPVNPFPPLPPMGQRLVAGTHASDPARLLQPPFGGNFNFTRTPGTPTGPRPGTPKPAPPSALRHPSTPTGAVTQPSPRPTSPPTVTHLTSPTVPIEYYGMTTHEGQPCIIKGQTQALQCLRGWNWRIDEIFATLPAAKVWEAQQKAEATAVPVRTPPQADDESDDDKKASRRKKRKKEKKRKKLRKLSKKGGYPSDSSSTSSSSSSSSSDSDSDDDGSSDSSDESSVDARPSSKAKKKAKMKARKKKRTRKKRRKKKDRRSLASGVDPSTNDNKKVFGFSIAGKELDEAIAPIGFPKKEREVLFEAAVDTASLPGMYLSKQMLDVMGDGDDLTNDRATDMAATLLTAGLGRKSNFRDTMWRQPKRHGLRALKDRTSFFTLAAAINKSKEPAFDQQDNRIRALMNSHGYDEAGIDDYLQRGLLGRITRDTFYFYQELMNSAREAHMDPTTGGDSQWEGGRGEALINHHAQKLLDLRGFAPDRRNLILKQYTYLRDAYKDRFNTPEMNTAMWAQLAQVQSRLQHLGTDSNGKKTPSAEGESAKCGHCRCTAIHRAFKVVGGKRYCPFAKKGFMEAKKLGKAATELMKKDPKLEPQAVVDQVIREHSP